jgi:hypothetical protein
MVWIVTGVIVSTPTKSIVKSLTGWPYTPAVKVPWLITINVTTPMSIRAVHCEIIRHAVVDEARGYCKHSTCVENHDTITVTQVLACKPIHPTELAGDASAILILWTWAYDSHGARIHLKVPTQVTLKAVGTPAKSILSS